MKRNQPPGAVRKAKWASVAAVAILPAAGVLVSPASAQASAPKLALGDLQSVARAPELPLGARSLGSVAANKIITGAVALTPRDDAGLVSYISEITKPGSELFHHYLTPAEFNASFAPSASTIATVRDTLQAEGLHISSVSSNGLLVEFSSPASRVAAAFHTGLINVRMPDGTVGTATSSAVRLPGAISHDVTGVIGLDNLVKEQSAGIMRAPKADAGNHPKATAPKTTPPAGAANACAAAQDAATEAGGLTDNQIAYSYGADSLYSAHDFGGAQTVAVYELESVSPADVLAFDQCYYGNAAAAAMAKRFSLTEVDGGLQPGYGSGEAILDVDDVSGMAPGANIDVYQAPNTSFGGLDEYNAIVTQDKAKVVTSSWGECEQIVAAVEPGVQQEENFIFQEAAAQGQSVFSAEGDTGVDSCNEDREPYPVSPILSVLDPASQPYVVSVGGTTIDNATQPPLERVWNDGAQWGAGGGGISATWNEPSWQADSLVPGVNSSKSISAAKDIEGDDFCNPAAGSNCRELPDVSAQADEFTGAVTVYSASFGGWITIGGTSSATPIWAGLLALINSSPTCSSNTATQRGVGFVSPLLYAVASVPAAYAASFNDVTVGNNDIYDIDNGQTFPATKGFDMASGLGSPELTGAGGTEGLAYYLCSLGGSSSRPAITGISPAFGSTTSPTTVTITGSGFESGSTSEVASVYLLNTNIKSFTVNSATSLSVTLPAGDKILPGGGIGDGAGLAQVVVTLKSGMSSDQTVRSDFEFVNETSSSVSPTVTGVSPFGSRLVGGTTVTIFGSGFLKPVSSVTFGGLAATNVTVVSPWKITATVPRYDGHTKCETGASPSNDICQVEVVVTTGHGSSAQVKILPAYEGSVNFNEEGAEVVPPDCGCEIGPAMTEFDYMPSPTITSISTADGPDQQASEVGGSTVEITGTGFNGFGLSGIYFGSPKDGDNVGYPVVYDTGTKLEIVAPGIGELTTTQAHLPIAVWTLAGTTKATPANAIEYSGVPYISKITPGSFVDSGGAPITVDGGGFTSTVFAEIVDFDQPLFFQTQYTVHVLNETTAGFEAPSTLPGYYAVVMCTTTSLAIAAGNGSDLCGTVPAKPVPPLVAAYPPGKPVVTGTSARSGPAGTKITLTGTNLGCAIGVSFGTVAATQFENEPGYVDCGSTTTVFVTVPAGKVGTTVTVLVKTVESQSTGNTPLSRVKFTFTK